MAEIGKLEETNYDLCHVSVVPWKCGYFSRNIIKNFQVHDFLKVVTRGNKDGVGDQEKAEVAVGEMIRG